MNYWVKFGIPALVLLVAVSLAWIMTINRPMASQTPVEQPTLLVNSFVVQPQDVAIKISVSGTVEPHTQTTLIAEVAGRIIEVSAGFQNGGFFRRGDVLLRIDPRNHRAELKRAEAALVRARTQLAQEESLAKYERGDFEKLKSVDPGIAVSSELSFRKAQVTRAVADLVAAEAQLIRAKGDMERTEVRMPYDGLIRDKRADLGQYLNPGSPLAVIFAVDFVEVRLPLSPPQVKKIALPGPHNNAVDSPDRSISVEVSIADEDNIWPAQLVRTEGVLDAKARTLIAIARVEDPYGLIAGTEVQPLRIGTFVDVAIPGIVLSNVYSVERHMLKPGNRIWVIDDEQRIRGRTVEVAYADARFAYISKGLNPGDRVCITPIENPLPGTRVRVVEQEQRHES